MSVMFQPSSAGGGSTVTETPFLINYILNPDAETDTTGWATYADSAANIPVDGTGGSATNLTFSRSTSSPLVGAASFLMAQANSTSLQGKGVSYDFTIDSAYQGFPLSIQFNYNASSTFVASNGVTPPLNDGTTTTNAGNSDVEVFIYDKTNSVLTYVTPQVITGNGTNNFLFSGVFLSSSSSSSYRIIFHVATTSANATGWNFKFDNVYVGPQLVTPGVVATDWQTETGLTFQALGTTSNLRAFSRRIGDTYEVTGTVTYGTTAGSAASITLPYTIDSTKMSSINGTIVGQNVGEGSAGTLINTTNDLTYLFYDGSDTAKLYFATSTSSNALVKGLGTGILAGSANPMTFSFKVPIAGWTSNVKTISSGSDTQIVAARMTGATASVSGAYSDVTWTTIVNDSTGSMGAILYTVPVSGYYDFSGQLYHSATTIAAGNVVTVGLINSTTSTTLLETAYTYEGTNTTSDAVAFNYRAVLLTAGTQVKIQVKSSASTPVITSSATENFLAVTKIQGVSNNLLLGSPTALSPKLAITAAATLIGNMLAEVDGSGGTFALTFDTAANYRGQFLEIKRTDSTPANIINLVVNGSTTVHLATQNESWLFGSDGTNWQVVNHYSKTPWATYSVAVTAVTTNPTFGTSTTFVQQWSRDGAEILINNYMNVIGSGGGSSLGSGVYLWPLPAGATANASILGITTATTGNAYGAQVGSFALIAATPGNCAAFMYDQSRMKFYQVGVSFIGSAQFGDQTVGSFNATARIPLINWEP